MVYRNIQTVALLILIAAFGTLLSTVIYDSGKHWRELGLAGEVVENVVKYEGLFLRCSLYPTGQEECGNLDPNNYPEFTTASRVLVIISLGSTVFAILGHFIGWSNTACLYKSKNSDKIKARVIIYAGVFGLLSALLLLVTGIMYSAGVASARSQDFLNQQNAELGGNVGQFRTGYTVALVWVSMALHLVYAALCFLSSWSDAKKSKLEKLGDRFLGENAGNYGYQPVEYDNNERMSNAGSRRYENSNNRVPNYNGNNNMNNNNMRDDDYV